MMSHTARRTRIALVAAAIVAATAPSWAADGELFGMDHTGRFPAPSAIMSSEEAALATTSAYAAAHFGAAPTREQVREQLRTARANGSMSRFGEIGDTQAVLQAREMANAEIGQAIVAEYAAEHQRQVAFAEAELRRAEIEQEGLLASAFGLGEGEVLMEPTGGAAIEGGDRVDVIDLSSAGEEPDERVIVSLDSGDAQAHERALYLRRQYAAMGLAQRRIYVESADA